MFLHEIAAVTDRDAQRRHQDDGGGIAGVDGRRAYRHAHLVGQRGWRIARHVRRHGQRVTAPGGQRIASAAGGASDGADPTVPAHRFER